MMTSVPLNRPHWRSEVAAPATDAFPVTAEFIQTAPVKVGLMIGSADEMGLEVVEYDRLSEDIERWRLMRIGAVPIESSLVLVHCSSPRSELKVFISDPLETPQRRHGYRITQEDTPKWLSILGGHE